MILAGSLISFKLQLIKLVLTGGTLFFQIFSFFSLLLFSFFKVPRRLFTNCMFIFCCALMPRAADILLVDWTLLVARRDRKDKHFFHIEETRRVLNFHGLISEEVVNDSRNKACPHCN